MLTGDLVVLPDVERGGVASQSFQGVSEFDLQEREHTMRKSSIATACAAVGFFAVLAGGAVATAQEIPLSGGTPSVAAEKDSNAAPGVARAGCELFTWEVGQSGNNLGVRGARQGCSDWGAITVELRKARPFMPDLNLAQASNSGTGYIDAVAYAGCNGRAQYFGKTISATGTTKEGPRFNRC